MEAYKVLRIDEMDFGCEGRPEGEDTKVLVTLEDRTGKKNTVSQRDKALYKQNIFEGDWVLSEQGELIKVKFTEQKIFTQDQIQELFLSVNWVSGEYPDRLMRALLGSSTVISVWIKDRLVGLARAIDDGELLAYLHYVLVHPDFQGLGIAGQLVEIIKSKYEDYIYLEGMPEEEKNVAFYEKHGFKIVEGATPIQIAKFK